MSEVSLIPMFPLALLPLPGELVPLHIFEPRYRQLLEDAETHDITFGIYFSHAMNERKVGACMQLESVIKRYPSGEADIIVKCTDIFTMDILLRTYKNKLYPGGEVQCWNIDMDAFPARPMYDLFLEYQKLRNISQEYTVFNTYQIANELNLELPDRYKFLHLPDDKRDAFLTNRIRFQIHLLHQEKLSKDFFHLN